MDLQGRGEAEEAEVRPSCFGSDKCGKVDYCRPCKSFIACQRLRVRSIAVRDKGQMRLYLKRF